MNIYQKLKFEGLFQIIKRDSNLEIIEETPVFGNIILDAGLDRMAQGSWLGKCVVGTGNSTPVETQISLDNPIAVTTTLHAHSTARQIEELPYYQSFSLTYRFAKGAAAGNLSEVAVGWGNQLQGEIFDRALIQDSQGNPTSITILENEFLDVVFTMRVYYETTHQIDTLRLVNQNGALISEHEIESYIEFINALPNGSGGSNTPNVSTNFSQIEVRRVMGNYTSSIWKNELFSNITNLGDELSAMSGTTTLHAWVGWPVYTHSYPDLRTAISQCTFSIEQANGELHGWKGMSTFGHFKCRINPKITKNNTETLTIGMIISWGRYEP